MNKPMTAEAWFARLHSPDCTEQDESAFERWLNADSAHSAAYATCKRVSAMSGDLRSQHALVDDLLADAGITVERPTDVGSRPWLGMPRIGSHLAAMATLAVLALGLHLALQSPSPDAPYTAVTAKGQQRLIALEDGSRIHLNTDTTLIWRISAYERRVELSHGEAFFDVAKDARRPFVVRAGSSEVRVVGTQFGVREEGGRLEVVVREGKVDVVPDSTRASGARPTRVELTPGKRLSYESAQDLVIVAMVDPDRVLTWRTGSIDFDSATLEEALAEVNRYIGKPMVIEDDRLRDLRLSARFRLGDVEAVTFTLRERFGIEAVESAERISLRAP